MSGRSFLKSEFSKDSHSAIQNSKTSLSILSFFFFWRKKSQIQQSQTRFNIVRSSVACGMQRIVVVRRDPFFLLYWDFEWWDSDLLVSLLHQDVTVDLILYNADNFDWQWEISWKMHQICRTYITQIKTKKNFNFFLCKSNSKFSNKHHLADFFFLLSD